MLIVYSSKTGNVRNFVKKTGLTAVEIDDALRVTSPFVLVTYTNGFGQIPEQVVKFLKVHHKHMRGVAASGNANWGQLFAKSADTVSLLYSVPVILKFELSGTPHDVATFIQGVNLIETY